MHAAYDSSGAPKTLYVGNLAWETTEDLMMVLFNQIGPVKGCKIIRDPGSDPYCFIEFAHHQAASAALTAMNRRQILGREMKVNWASSPGQGGPQQTKVKDTSEHHHIFVGDLSPEIDNETLRTAFTPFGEISDVKVMKDPVNSKPKGYGFVSFIRKEDAMNAIEQMNGQWLGSRSIRTNWATRQGVGKPGSGGIPMGKGLNYDEVFKQSSTTNTTVYIGGTTTSDEVTIREAFKLYGKIVEVRYFKDKGYAFVRYDNKESAASAIVACHLTEVGGQTIKCSWGKEGANDGPPRPDNPGKGKGTKRSYDGDNDKDGGQNFKRQGGFNSQQGGMGSSGFDRQGWPGPGGGGSGGGGGGYYNQQQGGGYYDQQGGSSYYGGGGGGGPPQASNYGGGYGNQGGGYGNQGYGGNQGGGGYGNQGGGYGNQGGGGGGYGNHGGGGGGGFGSRGGGFGGGGGRYQQNYGGGDDVRAPGDD